jgi:Putative peptidoglycan-binding domain-containing protein
MPEVIYIPEYITVHLGPPDAPAENITLNLNDYIKSTASDCVNPLWNENTLRAILCTIYTFTLNRIFKNYYRGKGYDFDITGDPGFDQKFDPGGCIFDNINRYADEISEVYIARKSSVEPLQTIYRQNTNNKSGILTSQQACELDSQGKSAYEILQAAFGDNIELVHGETNDSGITEQPQKILTLGSSGREVAEIQRRLNLISTSYPNIPKINPADGVYGPGTEAAVREFQRTFFLSVDGSAGNATRRRIRQVYDLVRKMLQLNSNRMAVPAACGKNIVLSEGDSGDAVRLAQYLLNWAALYNREIKPIKIDGMYRHSTTETVTDFQRSYDLPLTGDVDSATYNMLFDIYYGIKKCQSGNAFISAAAEFPGVVLHFGMQSPEVKQLQVYLNCAADLYEGSLGKVKETGVYGSETRTAVKALQRIHKMPQTGVVTSLDWDMITALYDDCAAACFLAPGQFPGYLIERKSGREVHY